MDGSVDGLDRFRKVPAKGLLAPALPGLAACGHKRPQQREIRNGNGTERLVPIFKAEPLAVDEIKRVSGVSAVHAGLNHQIMIPP